MYTSRNRSSYHVPVAYKRDEDKSVSRLPTDGKFGIRDRS